MTEEQTGGAGYGLAALKALPTDRARPGVVGLWITREELAGYVTHTPAARFMRELGTAVSQPLHRYDPTTKRLVRIPDAVATGRHGAKGLLASFGDGKLRKLYFDVDAVQSGLTRLRRSNKDEMVGEAVAAHLEREMRRRERARVVRDCRKAGIEPPPDEPTPQTVLTAPATVRVVEVQPARPTVDAGRPEAPEPRELPEPMVLDVPEPVWAGPVPEGGERKAHLGGTHRSPESHEREGHYRRQRVGRGRQFVRMVWVKATLVRPAAPRDV